MPRDISVSDPGAVPGASTIHPIVRERDRWGRTRIDGRGKGSVFARYGAAVTDHTQVLTITPLHSLLPPKQRTYARFRGGTGQQKPPHFPSFPFGAFTAIAALTLPHGGSMLFAKVPPIHERPLSLRRSCRRCAARRRAPCAASGRREGPARLSPFLHLVPQHRS